MGQSIELLRRSAYWANHLLITLHDLLPTHSGQSVGFIDINKPPGPPKTIPLRNCMQNFHDILCSYLRNDSSHLEFTFTSVCVSRRRKMQLYDGLIKKVFLQYGPLDQEKTHTSLHERREPPLSGCSDTITPLSDTFTPPSHTFTEANRFCDVQCIRAY